MPSSFDAHAFDPVVYINEPRWMDSRLGLERTVELLKRLGNPQDSLRFVHVAGTNGKGSTCAFLAQILQEAGYKTGLFTSPYIIEFEERIRIDGVNISTVDLTEVTLSVKQAADAMEDHPTEFELMTAVALLYFARQTCDIVVLEVGLGGRLDSTNVIAAPEVCVIASIALDHTAYLGKTLAAIAGEKAGIIKRGAPVVSWPQEASALQVVEGVAASHDTTVRIPDFSQVTIASVATPAHPRYRFSYRGYTDLDIGLMGSYQPFNATLALETVEVLREKGWNITDEALRDGLAQTKWPGRFEIVAADPTFVVDGGHNIEGAQALVNSLKASFPGMRPVFIIGVLKDKDYPEMLEIVMPLGAAFITITPDNPRALPADKLASAIRWTCQDMLGCTASKRTFVARDASDAVARAREIAGPTGLVCAFGSLYSLADIKAALGDCSKVSAE
ncbi:MAG: folylpolyglutamate synthase/dihydrofolate synthase family protein [Raoultibacter sp.]